MKRFHYLSVALILIITAALIQNPYTTAYVSTMKFEDVSAVKQPDELYQTIAAKVKDYEKPAQDAQIHTVWKATPGYNGLTIDIDESYEKMKKIGKFDEKQIVFKQVKPKVHLSDLPPAPIYRGHPDKTMVSFLINVAWGNEYLPSMLEVLDKHGVKATFFLEGRWAKENPALVKTIKEAGHEIGNHSYSHPDMARITTDQIRKQIGSTNEVIKEITGAAPVWFAPPSGSFRQDVITVADEFKMETVLWSVDTIDWQKPEPGVLVERVLKKVHNGAMILMHPTDSSSRSLETLIQSIKQKGYSFGSVSMLLDEERLPASN
ncbi:MULTISPECIES: polysaccharide deacetylase family protein [Metabacillus]|uniref:Polysaccharide deacetylase family protein n=1 Tax=Metabacillus hrfriensis TaxID=3048891 RepID=A0ACD4RHU0_9BACI|nr:MULTISPECIES: polysaccharide deacetylase family protein [Metabacillus]UAL54303.1 polysaccharide deacetylase family protein [Metabacillus dongyingensis]USK30623.1 polysaccharide deacetylase family protein [Bacillus sp. CMF21]WHZ59873.1 polysaccharide deacetylase family protein [Metabacillus sp. CT-WN-B3]